MIKIEKRNDVPTTLYFFTPFIAIILTIIGGGIIFYALCFNPFEALKFYFITPISNLYGLSELLLLKQNDKPIAIKHNGVALSNNSLKPYKLEIGVIK